MREMKRENIKRESWWERMEERKYNKRWIEMKWEESNLMRKIGGDEVIKLTRE